MNVAVSSRQIWALPKIWSLVAVNHCSKPGKNLGTMNAATLMRMIALHAGAAPVSHPEPRVLSR